MKRIFRRIAVPGALAVGIGATAMAMQTVQDAQPIMPVEAQLVEPAIADAEGLAQAFRQASRTALAGVVYVQVESPPRQASRQLPPGLENSPFGDMFQMPDPGPRVGSGSGFIISPDGYILTNNHVVDGATRVTVTMTDKRQMQATVVGRDPNTDVAVVKVDASNLPTVKIGNSDLMEVGDWVLALGYPLSLGETVTAGIVSAKGRNIRIMEENEEAVAPLEHFIQTDAAINPGNSGGPLVNLRGEVIGINSAIASPTGLYSGYGFAVPIGLAKRVADDLIRYGEVHRPKLGIQIGDVGQADVETFRLPDANGAVVSMVQDGPAKDAGVLLGDVIVAVDGQLIGDSGDLMERVALRQPGERVVLDVIRYGDRKRVNVTLGSFDSAPRTAPVSAAPANREDIAGQLGFAAAELTPQVANQLRMRGTGGVVVTQVDPNGPAPGNLSRMRLERINGKEISSLDDLRDVAGGLQSGSVVSVIGTNPEGEQIIVNYRLR